MKTIQGGVTGSDFRRQYGEFVTPFSCGRKVRRRAIVNGPMGRIERQLLRIYQKADEMGLKNFRIAGIEMTVRFEAKKE